MAGNDVAAPVKALRDVLRTAITNRCVNLPTAQAMVTSALGDKHHWPLAAIEDAWPRLDPIADAEGVRPRPAAQCRGAEASDALLRGVPAWTTRDRPRRGAAGHLRPPPRP